jgi:chromosome segregation ATPase
MATRSMAMSGRSAAGASESTSAVASRKTTKVYTMKTDGSGNVSTDVQTHVENNVSDVHTSAMRRMEERMRVIMDDLESEQSLRKRVEREKHELQMQIISLSERLTESEGGAESQLDLNRRREAEMAKLRKLLEDVHMESEQSIYMLKKKHQESMMEMQEHINSVTRSKEVVVKEKSKISVEVQELMAKIEVLMSERVSMKKVVERLEITVHEYNVKMEDLNRTVVDVQGQKSRMAFENTEAVRKLNEFKHAIDSAGLDKNKVSSQLKDLQTNLDDMQKQKHQAEARVHHVETSMKTVHIELEEMRETRRNLEIQIIKWKEECLDWKKKYENEARLRIEDVDSIKKMYGAQVADLTDKLDQLLQKMKAMEAQKVRLQQEISVLMKDYEMSQSTIKEFHMKLGMSEKRGDDLAAKLREMTNLYERADKENKQRAAEIVRLCNDMDRCKMDNEGLRGANGKLTDEVRALKMELDALKKRFHELDQENRKLAHDREELARAYKDADSNRNKAEVRVGELENELKKLRTDAERVIMIKDEELQSTKKKLMVEIESLTIRLQEAESRLRNEVEKMKQKMVITITELQMSLEAANKGNTQLNNTCKIQQTEIHKLSSMYEEVSRKLQSSVEQYQVTINKLSIVEQELNSMKSNFGASNKERVMIESKMKEMNVRIVEITNINNQLTLVKTKLEKELSSVSADYDDIARELKLADDRANKSSSDAQHFESLLREEHSKLHQVGQAKQALENEMRTLTVRMEEIESTSINTTRITIKKMESRIEELEILFDREKKMHVETMSALHKKDRSVKELLLQSEEDRKNIIILQESLDKLNEKIKMYKRQLEEQECISNSNIMRVKKFQRELESAESRAVDAESTLDCFRSRQRVFATAESRREVASDEVERQVTVKKVIHNVNMTNVNDTAVSSSSAAYDTSSSNNRNFRAGSTMADYRSGSTMADYRSGSTMGASADYRSGSVAAYRAGSTARQSSMARATSVGRSGSTMRY